jgi:hypothetical protein
MYPFKLLVIWQQATLKMNLIFRLNVKSEVHNIAVLHHIFLSFNGNFTGFAAGMFRAQSNNRRI